MIVRGASRALRRTVLLLTRPLRLPPRALRLARHARYLQIVLRFRDVRQKAESTPIIAYRTFGDKSELVKLLTSLAFDAFTRGQTMEQWQAGQWDSLSNELALVLSDRLSELENKQHCFREGASLDQYKIQDRIGDVSSCSTVYKARHGDTDIAIKAMYNFTCYDDEEMLEFQHFGPELMTCQHLSSSLPPHLNIVSVNSYFTAENVPHNQAVGEEFSAVFEFGRDETLYLEMPLYQCSLSQYLRQKTKLSFSTRLSVLFQIISSVHHLVLNNTVHRDIKCDNILITEEESSGYEGGSVQCVLTDFGMAHNSLSVTGYPYGRPWGSPFLMPPEVANSSPDSELDYCKSDIWCVGAICYELFGAVNPFTSTSSKSYTLSSLSTFPEQRLEYLVSRVLEPDTSVRWSSEQCLAYCGALLWLPHLIPIGGFSCELATSHTRSHARSHMRPGLDVIAEQLSLLCYRTLACKEDSVDNTCRLYFCQKVSSELIQSVL